MASNPRLRQWGIRYKLWRLLVGPRRDGASGLHQRTNCNSYCRSLNSTYTAEHSAATTTATRATTANPATWCQHGIDTTPATAVGPTSDPATHSNTTSTARHLPTAIRLQWLWRGTIRAAV